MSIVALADLLAGARPDSHCVALRDGKPITLARLRGDLAHNAQRLSARAVRRAAVVCADGYWFLVGMLALTQIGAEVILPPNSQSGTLRELAHDFDALLTDSTASDVAGSFALASNEMDAAPMQLDIAKSRLQFFTSGSTGDMKRIDKSLAQFEREAGVLEQMWGAELGEVPVMGTVTHQHVFGMTFRIMWPLLAGRPYHSEFHVAWEPLLAALRRPSVIISSPAQLTRMAGLAPVPPEHRPLIVITAGAPLPADAALEAREIFGAFPTEIFGSTEVGVIAWRRGATQPPLWQTLPEVEVAAGADGLLMLRSPHASPVATAGEWLVQADRIAFAPDGRFSLQGRVDRVVKIEGKRASLQRLEHEIAALQWVAEAAVVRLGDRRAYLGAVVKLSAAGHAEITRLGKFRFERMLRRELSATEDLAILPRRWRFVDSMPIDGLGKRRVRDVVALLEQRP